MKKLFMGLLLVMPVAVNASLPVDVDEWKAAYVKEFFRKKPYFFLGVTDGHLPSYYSFETGTFNSPEQQEEFKSNCDEYKRIYCFGKYAKQLQNMCTRAGYLQTECHVTLAQARAALEREMPILENATLCPAEHFIDDAEDMELFKRIAPVYIGTDTID